MLFGELLIFFGSLHEPLLTMNSGQRTGIAENPIPLLRRQRGEHPFVGFQLTQ